MFENTFLADSDFDDDVICLQISIRVKKMKGMMYGHCQEYEGMNRCCKEEREMNEKKKWQIQEK